MPIILVTLSFILATFGHSSAHAQQPNDRQAIVDFIADRRPAFEEALAAELQKKNLEDAVYPDISEYSYSPTELEQELLDAFNVERAKHDAQPVGFHSLLNVAAKRHADDMFTNEFFEHEGSDGSTPNNRVTDAGYTTSCHCNYKFGEILADGATDPAHAIQLWLDSPPHREIMLDPLYVHVGIKKQGQYWVAVFGMLTVPQ